MWASLGNERNTNIFVRQRIEESLTPAVIGVGRAIKCTSLCIFCGDYLHGVAEHIQGAILSQLRNKKGLRLVAGL